MRPKALVHSQHALGPDGPEKTVEGPSIEVPGLVVHAAHDSVRRMHEHAHDEAAAGAAHQMQREPLLHVEVLDETTFGEEVRGQLDAAAEAGAHHGRPDAAVESTDALGAMDCVEAVPGIAVVVLGADGQEGRVRLQAGLDEEEGGSEGCADDARGRAGEDINGQRLDIGRGVEHGREGRAERLVESEAAPVQNHLVDVLSTKPRQSVHDVWLQVRVV